MKRQAGQESEMSGSSSDTENYFYLGETSEPVTEQAPPAPSGHRQQHEDMSRLGDFLVEAGLVSRALVEQAALQAEKSGRYIGEVLVENGAVQESEVYRALAALHNLPYRREGELLRQADRSIALKIPRRFLEKNDLVPLGWRDPQTVIVATSNPRPAVAGLAAALGAETLDFQLVSPTDLRRLTLAMKLAAGTQDDLHGSRPAHRDLLRPDEKDIEVVSLFDAILLEAIAERASDIHLERNAEAVRLRLRVDGELYELKQFHVTPEQYLAIVNVIKIRARLDIAEHRLPQGGRFSTSVGDRIFDLRVQTQPSLYGEHVVIRLLSKELELHDIEDLGFPSALAQTYRRLLRSPAGLVLIIGPTGCGKSTTLYAGLKILSQDTSRKVITIEDPIESPMPNIQQTEVNAAAGFHFVHAMRAFVREDPDVILLGEIRDSESALEALRASQTGHLVLSTLHCNDSVDAVQRLFDLGMHPNSIASELLAVFAQRLAKRICPACKVPDQPDTALLQEIFPQGVPQGLHMFRGQGCGRCNGHGSHGRIAVVEYLGAGRALRRAITKRLPLDELRDVAFRSGLVGMREHALMLVNQGLIAVSELPEMFTPEQLSPARRLRPAPKSDRIKG